MRNVKLDGRTLRRLLVLATLAISLIAVAVLILSNFIGGEWVPGGGGSEGDQTTPLASLNGVPIPEPANLGEFVRDRDAAVKLGKALFWDMQVGSDGIQACASCHFQAGTDRRSMHQVNPGSHAGDAVYHTAPPNTQLTPAGFPTHKLADPTNRDSPVLFDSNDVISSQGMFTTTFVDIVPGRAEELGSFSLDPVFNVNGTNVRRVEPIDTQTTINAIFNFRSFWQGRAQNVFNGVNPHGE